MIKTVRIVIETSVGILSTVWIFFDIFCQKLLNNHRNWTFVLRYTFLLTTIRRGSRCFYICLSWITEENLRNVYEVSKNFLKRSLSTMKTRSEFMESWWEKLNSPKISKNKKMIQEKPVSCGILHQNAFKGTNLEYHRMNTASRAPKQISDRLMGQVVRCIACKTANVSHKSSIISISFW